MRISKKLHGCLMLVCLFLTTQAHADEKILDRIEIVQTKTEANIHIEFQTQVRYLRHYPTKETSRIQVFLDFPQLSALPVQREVLSSPPTDLVPSFAVIYPDQVTNSIAIKFSKPVKFRITPASSGRGIVIHVPLAKAVVTSAPEKKKPISPVTETAITEVPTMPPGMSVNDYAGKLVGDSRVAMGLGDYPKAIQLLNAALNFPPHDHSQEAQELIGIAREKNGELTKAKAEFDLYLKLYPTGDGAERVRQHLAAVDAAAKVSGVGAATKEKKEVMDVHETDVYGSWNQYYYDAHSHNYNPSPIKNSHTHDQSSFVSGIDLTARSRQNEYESKFVFRNTQTMDFLPGDSHSNRDRTTAAYVEVANKEADYLVRVGRQNGNSGGVLGRFDGAWLRYGLTPQYRINLVAGSLDEFKVDYKRHFYGINLDIGPLAEKWSGNAFFINQEVDNLTDRRAVGGEIRYFDNGRSIYSLLDYDTTFKKVNIAMVQGNWLTEGGTNYNMLIDHRKSPILSMVNSLPAYFGAPVSSTTLAQALRTGLVNESTIRHDALAQTLDTDLVLFGATKQVTPRWQLGGDIQVNRNSGTKAAGQDAIDRARKAAADAGTFFDPLSVSLLQSSLGSGNIWTYHVQAVGLDTVFKDDTSIISASYTTGRTSRVQSLVFSNVVVPRDKWRIDSSLKLLRLDSDPSSLSYVVSPTLRANYRLADKATLEAEIGLEVVNTNDLSGHSRTFRDFSFIGYRLDF